MQSTTTITGPTEQEEFASRVREIVSRRLCAKRPCAFYFKDITFCYSRGVLTLQGRVATDRLRHSLQSLLAGVHGVAQINNQVDVINSNGLSSVSVRALA